MEQAHTETVEFLQLQYQRHVTNQIINRLSKTNLVKQTL